MRKLFGDKGKVNVNSMATFRRIKFGSICFGSLTWDNRVSRSHQNGS